MVVVRWSRLKMVWVFIVVLLFILLFVEFMDCGLVDY